MNVPATLIDRLREHKVLPFIGAGVSMQVKAKIDGRSLFPSWQVLLEHAADKLDNENKKAYGGLVRNFIAIDEPNYMEAAKYAQKALGPSWITFLKESFDHRREAALDESLDLARAAWTLGSNLLITTNYDRVLRWTCMNQDDIGIWNIEAPAEQVVALRGAMQSPVVWHLHGQIDDASSIILTPDGYDRLYPSTTTEVKYNAALSTLRGLLTSHCFLFIGFSLNDAMFGLQLKTVSSIFAGTAGPHYALIHKDSIEQLKGQHIPGVELIAFEDYGSPLLDLVEELSQEARNHRVTPHLSNKAKNDYGRGKTIIEVSTKDDHDNACDTPPPVTPWVGRNEELSLLKSETTKVIAITGIGGQGKSTLVAKYLTDLDLARTFWDWRDCKEQSNTLHTHIVRLIERTTAGNRRATELANETTESVIKLFLNITSSIKGVFVFDNIDQYVDVYKLRTVGFMDFFIQGILKGVGDSKFIFTSRPKIVYENPSFLQLELNGLSIDEAEQLFGIGGARIERKNIVEIHELTQGHPLWISLIAKQVFTNSIKITELIERVRAGKDAGLPNAMLLEIWQTLKPKHQKLLRYLAEATRPETEAQLQSFVERDFNGNQFRKAIKQLRNLDLVVVKSPTKSPDTFELHPLLREFVRRQFSRDERNPYISALILIIDKTIVKFKTGSDTAVSYAVLQHGIAKIELLINSGKYNDALFTLSKDKRAILANGYSEDFVRLASSLFTHLHTTESINTDEVIYEEVFKDFVNILSQLGRYVEADQYMHLFEQTISGATARYVALCEIRSYSYWLRGNFDLGKEWGRRGVMLKQDGHLDTRHDSGNNLALSQRDSGDIDPALEHFREGVNLEQIIDPAIIDLARDGAFYGNIARCLFLKSDRGSALNCLIKSAWILEKSTDPLSILNQGWAAFWFGELMEDDNPKLAYVFYRHSVAKWEQVSPPSAEKALSALEKASVAIDSNLSNLLDWQIARRYRDWLTSTKQFPTS